MKKTVILSVAILALMAGSGEAQDGKAVLEAVAKRMGATDLKTMQYAGSGSNYAVGQSPSPGAPWPRFNVISYTRRMNFETHSLVDEVVRTQAEDPPRGGGGQPLMGEQRVALFVSGTHAWNQVGNTPVPRPWERAERLLQLWISPHGVIKAALANNAAVQSRMEAGKKMLGISFASAGLSRVNAMVNDRDLVERVEAWVDHPVLGDMRVETSYGDYREFAGVQFPTRIRQSQGGFPTLDITVSQVQPNVPVDIQVPEAVRDSVVRVDVRKVSDGVWYLTGGTHHSVAVEMQDHVIVVEGPLYDGRAMAVIAEVKKAVPNKPIKYLVNTHHHFDHSGGIRAFAAEGAIIITHDINKPFWEQTFAAPRTLNPDRLAQSGRKASFETLGDKRVLTDGVRTVEIYHIKGSTHTDGLIMAYLPKERLLIEADAYTPAPPNTPPPARANPFSVNLYENIERLKLAIDQVLPIHGRMVPLAELQRAIGRTP